MFQNVHCMITSRTTCNLTILLTNVIGTFLMQKKQNLYDGLPTLQRAIQLGHHDDVDDQRIDPGG